MTITPTRVPTALNKKASVTKGEMMLSSVEETNAIVKRIITMLAVRVLFASSKEL